MNALDVLEYGHQTVMNAVKEVPADQWEHPIVPGGWTVKDTIAHLASFELLLLDVLHTTFCHTPSTLLERWIKDGEQFNHDEVAARANASSQDVLNEYREAHFEVINMILRIPPDELRQTGLLPWYGDGYDVEDFIVYAFYGHKREHSAQINLFRDHLMSRAEFNQYENA